MDMDMDMNMDMDMDMDMDMGTGTGTVCACMPWARSAHANVHVHVHVHVHVAQAVTVCVQCLMLSTRPCALCPQDAALQYAGCAVLRGRLEAAATTPDARRHLTQQASPSPPPSP